MNSTTTQISMPTSEHPAGYRIGAVSKLSGVPVSTLRVWEQRYEAFKPDKSKGQHRLYTPSDLERAGLLKRLNQMGHSISHVARLDHPQLQALVQQANVANGGNMPSTVTPSHTIRLGVVGDALATQLRGKAFAQKWTQLLPHAGLHLAWQVHAFGTGPTAWPLATPQTELVDGVCVQLQNLHPEHTQALLAWATTTSTPIGLTYQYARTADQQALTQAGIKLYREPISPAELAQKLADQFGPQLAQRPSQDQINLAQPASALAPARRYSDATLASIAQISGNVLCECPKHVAELTSQLAAFEQYSQSCQQLANQDPADAELHRYLLHISGQARAWFEVALERIALHEGIALPTHPES
jgi:DNA-binding transcriptional MerR regulator